MIGLSAAAKSASREDSSIDSLEQLQFSLIEQMDKFVANTKKTAVAKRTHGYYLGRVNGWHELWQKFAANDRTISTLATDKDQAERSYFKENLYSKYEELFYEFKGELVDKLNTVSSNQSDSNQSTGVSTPIPDAVQAISSSPSVQLPTISLPKFSGDYADWISFRDLFISLIESNKSLANVQKLHYLKANVVGNAAKVIKQFNITNDNYHAAWQALTQRYENKRILITAQLRALTSQPKTTTESSSAIKTMIDITTECLASLTNLDVSVDAWDPLLIHLLIHKLPPETHRAWEEKLSDNREYPTWKMFKDFLETRFRTLEALNDVRPKENPQLRKKSDKGELSVQSFFTGQTSCKICHEKHSVRACKSFLKNDPSERLKLAKAKGYCINCLGEFHSIKKCRSKSRCMECRGKHHTLLHLSTNNRQISELHTESPKGQPQMSNKSNNTDLATKLAAHYISENHAVLLATAEVGIEGPNGVIKVRALIDPGSQATFITSSTVSRLGLKTQSKSISVTGIGTKEAAKSTRVVQITITSTKCSSCVTATAVVLDTLTDMLPSVQMTHLSWQHLEDLDIADPNFNIPARVDVIIGADIYPLILREGVRKGPQGTPVGQNTIFGWILTGKTSHTSQKPLKLNSFNVRCSIEEQLKRFWEVEEVICDKKTSLDDDRCEEIYKTTHFRNPDGSYVVRLPFKEERPNLGESRQIALKRFLCTERSNSKKGLLDEYNKGLEEYVSCGHMVEACSSNTKSVYNSYYLPHHAVLKPSSTTTQLRVVFNASCPTSNGVSLNDCLLVGPSLQQDITDIISRWRYHRYVFTADIEKMYRQIWIHPEDSQYQKILWRNHPDSIIREYQLKTVTFGVSCAPYLAIRTLQQLAEDERINFPHGSKCLVNDFYVDDVLTGGDTLEDVISLQLELTALLSKGHFTLRKFSSNDSNILEKIPESNRSVEALKMQFSDNTILKALGIYWNPKTDEFQYRLNFNNGNNWTKRNILSNIAKLFDPLGWISPVIVQAKIFMQKLWTSGTDWDETIPEYLRSEWANFVTELPCIERLNLPRWLNTYATSTVELHGFCDSSENAYAAAIYLRVINPNQEPVAHLLVSKTRVAPIKTISLPRLELCGAVLLSRLIKSFRESSKQNCKTVLWTDSMIVLSWIRSLPHRWKSFVANRITEINENVGNANWRHVPSQENPADLASRGIPPSRLIENILWWEGPSWLKSAENNWPQEPRAPLIEEYVEEKKKLKTFHLNTVSEQIIERFSNLTRACRVIAHCRKFMNICRKLEPYPKLPLSANEIQEARLALIKVAQLTAYSQEIECLRAKQNVPRKSSLLTLNPFLDEKLLLRVGGRLEHSNLTFDEKHPIILPPSNKLSELLIDEIHKDTLHGGMQLTLNTLREKYWIPRAKQLIKKKIHECNTCFRWKRHQTATLMGELPAERITPARPFTWTGIDFAGPVLIKSSKTRNARSTKGYIAVFVCFATKATHLELVSDLSSECFLAALRRFFARRGFSKKIFSDNATNFVGAERILYREIAEHIKSYQQIAADVYANKNVEWHFIPPRAPHFGGLWEASVKSMKYHLRRIVGQALLTFEELTTLLSQIEAVMNSRPLCPLSSDPTDFRPLTPGHFLVGSPLLSLPERNYEEINASYPSLWHLLQKLHQDFWKRWSTEYLQQLQRRPKWKEVSQGIDLGDLVLLKDELLPPSCWKLARVIELFPGSDNITRVVRLKTSSGEFKRAITKICPLPSNRENLPKILK